MKNKLYITVLAIASFAFIGTASAQFRHGNGHQNWKHEREYNEHNNDKYNGHDNRVDYRNDGRYNRHERRTDHFYENSYYGQGRHHDEYRPVYWAQAHRYNYRRHVYFPDYHVFYDAGRRGYVYQNRGQWIFSAVIPAIFAGVDFANARVEYMNGVPLNDNPEAYYNNYNNAPNVNLSVHVRW